MKDARSSISISLIKNADMRRVGVVRTALALFFAASRAGEILVIGDRVGPRSLHGCELDAARIEKIVRVILVPDISRSGHRQAYCDATKR